MQHHHSVRQRHQLAAEPELRQRNRYDLLAKTQQYRRPGWKCQRWIQKFGPRKRRSLSQAACLGVWEEMLEEAGGGAVTVAVAKGVAVSAEAAMAAAALAMAAVVKAEAASARPAGTRAASNPQQTKTARPAVD